MQRYSCPACGGAFASQEELTAHAEQEHQPAQTYTCRACGGQFGTREELQAHATQEHSRV